MKDKKYTCISCELYDQLELFSLQKKEILLEYYDEKNNIQKIETIITNLITKNKEEFLITDLEQKIRLDKIISIHQKST